MHYILSPVREKTGFTLVEIFITTTLISVIVLTTYASLNQGIRIYKRLSLKMPGQDLNIFFDTFGRDLRNSLKFSKIKFTGDDREIRFAALVRSQSKGAGLRLNIGEVVYSFDKDSRALKRSQRNFSELYQDNQADEGVLLQGTRDLNFQYYFYDAESKQYLWRDEWTEENLPEAVRINIHLESNKQGKGFIARTISIPVSR